MLVAVRATHEHLDLEVLDALTRDADRLPAMIEAVHTDRAGEDRILSGWVVVSTCNRLEVYLDAHRFHEGVDIVIDAVAHTSGMDREVLSLCFEAAMDAPVPQHLYEVTAGLRSLVIGEAEIAGQVRAAFESARRAGRTTSMLNDLFQRGFRCAKRVATEAPLGAAGRSGIAVALDRAATEMGGLTGRSVLVTGTGAYARLGVTDLTRRGVADVRVHSGSGRAPGFAERHGVAAIPADGLGEALHEADLVLACSGRGTSLFPEQLLGAGPTLVLDLALHSDLHPLVRHLDGVRILTLSDLAVDLGADAGSALFTARNIIEEAVESFRAQQEVRRVDPAMAAMRREVAASADTEIARLRRETSDDLADQVERSIQRVLAKAMHSPAVRARQLAEDGYADEYVQAFHTIFGIDISSRTEPAEPAEASAGGIAPAGWMRVDRTVPPRIPVGGEVETASAPAELGNGLADAGFSEDKGADEIGPASRAPAIPVAAIARAALAGGCPVDLGVGHGADHGMGREANQGIDDQAKHASDPGQDANV